MVEGLRVAGFNHTHLVFAADAFVAFVNQSLPEGRRNRAV